VQAAIKRVAKTTAEVRPATAQEVEA